MKEEVLQSSFPQTKPLKQALTTALRVVGHQGVIDIVGLFPVKGTYTTPKG